MKELNKQERAYVAGGFFPLLAPMVLVAGEKAIEFVFAYGVYSLFCMATAPDRKPPTLGEYVDR